jgi:hypothetical protein
MDGGVTLFFLESTVKKGRTSLSIILLKQLTTNGGDLPK